MRYCIVLLTLGLALGCSSQQRKSNQVALAKEKGGSLPKAQLPTRLDPDKRVENPDYQYWAKFKPGTSVDIVHLSEAPEQKYETTETHTLLQVTAMGVKVEIKAPVTLPDGSTQETAPRVVRHPRWVSRPLKEGTLGQPPGTYETGEETITVDGKEYATRWYKARGKVEAGDTETQTWFSEEVPGGLLKRFHAIPASGKTIRSEARAIKQPEGE